MKSKTIKAMIFDLGNVVIKFDPNILDAEYRKYCKAREGAFVEYLLDSDNINKYMEGKLSSSRFYSKTKRMFRMDIKYGEFYGIWNAMFTSYPEMEEIIRKLKENYPQIKLILLSNTNEVHYNFVKEEYKVLDLFDGHLLSHEFGKQKPHPEIYKEAMRMAGTIPRDTFYTDDREDLIEAARIMGIKAYQFTGHEGLIKQLSKFGIEV
jgi:HAD superfamily hydrolase (TIGR01509 family)